MTAIVTRGDAGNLHLPDETVDLVVTSPPYFGLRSYQDGGEHYAEQIGAEATPAEYIDALMACTAEWMRVLKPGGSIFVNLGDKYSGYNNGSGKGRSLGRERHESLTPEDNTRDPAAYGVPTKSLIGLPWRYAIRCIDELGLILRAEIVWAKPNGLPESVTDRVRREHEQVFHFTKEPNYFAQIDGARVPYSVNKPWGTNERSGLKPGAATAALRGHDPSWHHQGLGDARSRTEHPLGRVPGSVWEIASAALKVPAWIGVDHFAAYPPELVKRIVLGWSPDGGTVLDPFGGTGTTALVAHCCGRVGISVDLSADYCRLAQWRTTDPGERARVLGVDKPPIQVDGQLGMFEGIGA